MAAALSRALKLPGKKGSELGEYDPLTQADSEDESEEDDLVLNYPRNGLGRGSTRAGGLGLDSGSDPEAKRIRMRGVIRTTVFLVPLCCAVLLVLLCAFLLPCQQGELNGIPQWETGLGEVGVNSPPLALWDVDNDTIEDVLVSVTQLTNDSRLGGPQGNSKEHSVAAVSAVRGNVLWKTGLKEPALSIQCGMRPQARPVAPPRRTFPQRQSVSGALDAATGKMLWTVSPGQIVSQVVSVPDLTGDAVPDLLIAALPADQASDLSLLLLSGVSGGPIGHPVTFNVTTQGKLIGPELHVTKQRAYYILFGLGTVEAVWLTDIYTQATSNAPSRTKVSPALRVKEWELRIHISILIPVLQPSPAASPADPVLRKLYLLHPAYPTILAELTSTTDTILTAAVSYQEQQKDASYVTVSSRHPPADPKPDAQVVKRMRVKALITDGRTLRLGEPRHTGQSLRPGDFEINKFFRQLSFRPHQVKTKEICGLERLKYGRVM
uniref:Family with sequence similarity 234 member B n=1 Tax=Paramormyrops kingsleyae TaxID=1676925 RepID=A0A3B3S171_9TELE